MKSSIRTAAAVVTAIAACGVIGITSISADDKKKAPLTEEEMTKNFMAASTPGAEHKRLEVYAGEWDVHSKIWMQPGAPPMETDGTASGAAIFGGRFIEMTVKSTFMGQPFEGRAITGYNNMRKSFNSFWIDSMGTSMTLTAGSVSSDGKTFTFEGKMDDCMTGEKDKTYRFIDRIVSKDEIHSEGHDLSLGKDSKMMEMTYKRKK